MDITAAVFLIVLAALPISGIWYLAVRKRAEVSIELQRQFTDQAAETKRLLTDMSAQLAELDRRTAEMHRILKDAE